MRANSPSMRGPIEESLKDRAKNRASRRLAHAGRIVVLDPAFSRPWPFSRVRWNDRNDALCMKNRAKAARPKSVIAILPLRPFRGSGKVAQTARKPARRDGKSSIPTVNHFFADLGIQKIRHF